MEIFNDAMKVFKSEKYRRLNPSLPWETYRYTMHFDRTVYLQAARDSGIRTKMPDLYQQIVMGVLESAEYVYHHQEHLAKIKNQTISAKTQYVYAAAQYHAGRIGILLNCAVSADEKDYTDGGITKNLNLPVYAKTYFDMAPPDVKSEFQPRIDDVLKHIYRYLVGYPADDSINPSWQRVWLSLRARGLQRKKNSAVTMMNYLLVCHALTCVHSQMVAILTQSITKQLIRVNSAALVGVIGTISEEEVVRRGDFSCFVVQGSSLSRIA